MDHGLSFLPDVEPGGPSPSAYYDMLLELSELGDQAGLSHVKMTEHYLKSYGGYCPSPLTFLAAVAARTKRVRLMTGCVLPAFHHPVQLASWASMVDAMSHGRLDLGVARAYMPYEFDAFGVPLNESRDRFDRTVEAVVELLAREDVSMSAPYFSFDNVTVLPRPVQRGGPPVWVAAVRSEASFVQAGEKGRGLLVTPALGPLQHMRALIDTYRANYCPRYDGDEPRVLASMPLFVGLSEQHAYATADPLLEHYLDVWARAASAWDDRKSSDYLGYSGMAAAIRSFSAKQLRLVGSAVVGSVAQVVDRIGTIASILGNDGFLWQVDYGAVDAPTARGNVELFCSEVLPQVRTLSATAVVAGSASVHSA
jgi:alkanesulfonate monooxygenase SsuD/methylene tetrahydromethanopterin reductase-like flavin-dependent oxidoreductase (luciferase family)